MKRNAFLIRASQHDLSRLQIQIENFEKHHVDYYVIEERYGTLDKTFFKSPNHVVIGSDYLSLNNLANFTRVGWQCGDYVGYIGYDFFPNYDFYWLIDSDLYLNLDINELVSRANKLDYDCIATNYDPAQKDWHWRKSLEHKYQAIYKMLYGLVRFSRSALSFLKNERSQYHPEVNGRYSLFANDECFTATVLTNNGFSCKKIQNLFPEYFLENLCTLNKLVLSDELSNVHTKNQVIHPLYSVEAFNEKVASFLESNDFNIVTDRTYGTFCRLGQERCNEILDINLVTIYKKKFNSEHIVNLLDISKKLNEKKLQYVKKSWFWTSTTYAIDFSIRGVDFGIDLTADGSVFIVPRNDCAKKVIKDIFANEGSKTCIIKQHDYVHRNFDLTLRKSHLSNILNIIFYISGYTYSNI